MKIMTLGFPFYRRLYGHRLEARGGAREMKLVREQGKCGKGLGRSGSLKYCGGCRRLHSWCLWVVWFCCGMMPVRLLGLGGKVRGYGCYIRLIIQLSLTVNRAAHAFDARYRTLFALSLPHTEFEKWRPDFETYFFRHSLQFRPGSSSISDILTNHHRAVTAKPHPGINFTKYSPLPLVSTHTGRPITWLDSWL